VVHDSLGKLITRLAKLVHASLPLVVEAIVVREVAIMAVNLG